MGETPSGAEKFETEENRASFHARLNRLGYSRWDDTFEKMDAAYDFSKEAHRLQARKTGERYFEHPRSVALILLDECKIKDPNTIIASLLHDSVEDSPLFANRTMPPSQWEKIAYKRLGAQFNQEVAGIVISLTKPTEDGKELKTKEEAHDYYFKNLTGLSESENAKILLVKMSDRLHNLRTSISLEDKLKDKIIKETEKDYFPLFENFWSKYNTSKDKNNGVSFVSAGQYMLEKMKDPVLYLKELSRVSSNIVLMVTINNNNMGNAWHRWYHAIRKAPWDHGNIAMTQKAGIIKAFTEAGLQVLEAGAVDVPPSMDTQDMPLKDDIDRVVRLFGKRWEWGLNNKVENKSGLLDCFCWLEANLPSWFKNLNAHHIYVVGKATDGT